jgi:hypothetical protein
MLQTPINIDSGQAYTYTANAVGGTPGYTYSWTTAGLTAAPGTCTTGSTCTVTMPSVTTSTPYNVAVTVGDSSQETSSATSALNVYPQLTPKTPTASLQNLDQGQLSQVIVSVAGGAPAYAYQWYEEAPSSVTYSPIPSATSSSYIFTTNAATQTGTWEFKAQITDNSVIPVTVNSTTVGVTVSPGLGSNLIVVPESVDVGATATLTANIGGGQPPYTYNFIVTNGGNVVFNQLNGGKGDIGSTTNSIEFTPSPNAIGTDTVNVVITDANYNTNGGACYPAGNSLVTNCEILSNTITVNAGITPPTFTGTPSNYIDPVAAATSAGS